MSLLVKSNIFARINQFLFFVLIKKTLLLISTQRAYLVKTSWRYLILGNGRTFKFDLG
jgi:hypothetical protein